MEIIVGLGGVGCNVANQFSNYNEYDIYQLDNIDKEERNYYCLPTYKRHEDYEKELEDLEKFFEKIFGDCLFIVSGASSVSGASLVILEKISQRCNINILYIKPDMSLFSELRTKQEKVVFQVLQQYTRSGVFEKMFIVNNTLVEEVVGTVSVKNYYNRINELIVSTLHMINVFKHSELVFGTFSPLASTANISTFGIVDPESGEDKLFYDIEMPREKVYYYGIPNEKLENDENLLKKIKGQMVEKVKQGQTKISYGLYATSYDEIYCYSTAHATLIQEENINFFVDKDSK